MKFTDESVMPFGKHKGKKMANVPAQYLLWIWENTNRGINNAFYRINRNVFDYIEQNLKDLKIEAKREQNEQQNTHSTYHN